MFNKIIKLVFLCIVTFTFTNKVIAEAEYPGVPPSFLFLPQHSVAATDGVLSALSNPAALGVHDESGLLLMAPYIKDGDFGDWGIAFKGGGLGFTAEILQNTDQRRRYTLGTGGGEKGVYIGYSYSWTSRVDRQNTWDIGMLYRPLRCVSLGAVARGVNMPKANQIKSNIGLDFGLAVRPLAPFGPIGNNLGQSLTLTADVYLREYDKYTDPLTKIVFDEESYSDNIAFKIGAIAEIVPGITAHFDYLPKVESSFLPVDEKIYAGLTFNFGQSSIGDYHDSDEERGSFYMGVYDFHKKSILKYKKKKFVEIKLEGSIIEHNRSSGLFSRKSRTVLGFHRKIEKYTQNPEIEGMILKIGSFSAGWAKLQEMRNALQKFKDSGKKIIVFLETAGNGTYYLASIADRIYLPPTGDIYMTGLAAHMLFLRGTLDKIGIEPQLEHIGDYKSASDMLTRHDMSEAQAEATNAILDDIFDVYVTAIAEGRGMEKEAVITLFNSGPFTSEEAFEAKLIDSLIYIDQLNDVVEDFTGRESPVHDEKYFAKNEIRNEEWNDVRRKKIAIVYGTGAITSGSSSNGGLFGGESMGSETIAEAIRNARNDESVDAILFRVDSPGGSALASELILREVTLCTEGDDKKPIIVSMSDVAGSGGYYVACQADTIIALPNTITGSIGVISGKFTYDELQRKIGVNGATLRRGEHADMYAGYRSFTDDEWAKLRDQINQMYQIFLQRVAAGRGMDTSAVNKIAQGRIWSGTAAKELNLIDETGGLDLAIEITSRMAGIKDDEEFDIAISPKSKYEFGFGSQLKMMVRNTLPESVLNAADKITSETKWNDGQALYIMPYQINIE